MKVLVCVKVSNGEINPFDESALEWAFRISDDVTVLSMGPENTSDVLKPLTRLGAKVTLLSDSLFAGSDTLATAYILSVAASKIGFDLILCGKQSIDGDTAQVGPMLSEFLKCNLITNALDVAFAGEKVQCKTRFSEETASLPALVTVERSAVLRFPSIFSKACEVDVLNNAHLGCDESHCGLSGSPTRVLQSFTYEKGKRKCKFISRAELLPLVERLLKEKSKAEESTEEKAKLSCVWAVGSEVLEKASEISERVVLIKKTDAETIAERARNENPSVILWNADLWGRKTAPRVAAILETGLCADCTHLEADGETLIMYRPAKGGSVYAKIKCLKNPQMATVRTKQGSGEIIVSGGKGVAESLDKLHAFAKELNAEMCASRGLVDMGKAEYTAQVGLTGKTVSPKIYIAVGISGAVHHTCAIEGADTVIAINPDKEARIFEYADYGILEEF